MEAADDQDAGFTAFVRASRHALRRAAYLLCGDVHEADDLVQTALLSVYRRWRTIKDPTSATAYARRCLVNAYITERRHVRWHREHPDHQLPELLAP